MTFRSRCGTHPVMKQSNVTMSQCHNVDVMLIGVRRHGTLYLRNVVVIKKRCCIIFLTMSLWVHVDENMCIHNDTYKTRNASISSTYHAHRYIAYVLMLTISRSSQTSRSIHGAHARLVDSFSVAPTEI